MSNVKLIPLLSFIVPVYNTSLNLLNRCLNSIIGNKESWFEVIIVDDGSEDTVRDQCDCFLIDKRVKVIHQCNMGVSVARNVGVKLAKGKYISFVDPDDIVDSDYFNKSIFEYSKSEILLFMMKRMSSSDKICVISIDKIKNIKPELQNNILFLRSQFGSYYGGAVWGKAFKREFLEKFNLSFNPNLRKAQDRLFMLQAVDKASTIEVIPVYSYIYYENLNSICNIYKPDVLSRSLNFYHAMVDYINKSKTLTIQKNKAISKLSFLTLFEILYLDLFNCNNPTKYWQSKNNAIKIYYELRCDKLLQQLSHKDCVGLSEKLKLFLIKWHCWRMLWFIIHRKQKGRGLNK